MLLFLRSDFIHSDGWSVSERGDTRLCIVWSCYASAFVLRTSPDI